MTLSQQILMHAHKLSFSFSDVRMCNSLCVLHAGYKSLLYIYFILVNKNNSPPHPLNIRVLVQVQVMISFLERWF